MKRSAAQADLDNKLVQRVVGLDFNALYLHSNMQEMPIGHPDWWASNETGIMERQSKTIAEKLKERKCHGEIEYLRYRSWRDKVQIQTGEDGPQVKLGARGYRVDGYIDDNEKPVVINYNGCYYHSHGQGCLYPPANQQSQADERKRQDAEQEAELRRLGMEVVTVWECEFRAVKTAAGRLLNGQSVDPVIQAEAEKYNQYLARHPTRHFHYHQRVSEAAMLEAIIQGQVFGFAKVNIETPDDLKELYEDFPPIIKHTDISREDISPFMQQIAEENGRLKKPEDALIGSYFGKEIWLMTPLLKFYHDHGLKITKIHEVVQFDGVKVFEWFGQTVTEHRKQGDADKNKAILAEVFKLLGNSAYGKCITNLRRHQDIFYADTAELDQWHNEACHSKSVEVAENCFEIRNQKKEIEFNLPMVIGLAVYNYAKLRVLAFIYDVLLVYFDKADYMFLESDTDSVYLAISAPNLEDLVKPELRAQFDAIKHNWFVQDPSQKRTPGLLKVEKEADKFIGLCSKCYICVGSDGEITAKAKGAQARNKDIMTFENFYKVLFNLPDACRVAFNVGIRPVEQVPRTYFQEKKGLTSFYAKRICLPDGSTLPLKL